MLAAMRVLIAPQAFKGSLPASKVAEAVARGLPAGWRADLLPMADGGEGTVEALLAAAGGRRRSVAVEDPLGRPVTARWALLKDGQGVIEMAAASGLPLLAPHERDPRRATTYGTGQLIRAALDAGVKDLMIGIGGSATNDGGAFTLQALGARLLDGRGKQLPRAVLSLRRLQRIDLSGLHPALHEVRLRVMSDVTNPLLGPNGATAVYGPQKGVTTALRTELEAALKRWADVLEGETGQPLRDAPGAGAAGGLGFALLAIGGQLEPGAELVLDAANFDRRIKDATLVITGEGRLDSQSMAGKSTIAVARRAKRAGVPALAIVGGLGPGYEEAYRQGLSAVMPIAPGPIGLDEAQKRTAELITAATERAFRMMAIRLAPH
jgi:glycerate kinase